MSAEQDWAVRGVGPPQQDWLQRLLPRETARWERDKWVIEGEPGRAPTQPFLRILWSLALGAMLLLPWLGIARAHSPDRPDLDDWLMAQTNQHNGMCCDGEDVIALSDNEWRVQGDHYEVVLHGKWTPIESWMLTKSPENRMSSALLWVWDGHPQCFKPGTFY